MIHRGKILEKAIIDSGISKTFLAEQKLYIHRTTLYEWFQKPDLDLDVLIKVGKEIKYDFSQDIPEISSHVSEPFVPYGRMSVKECQEQLTSVTQRYNDLLERYTRLLEKPKKK